VQKIVALKIDEQKFQIKNCFQNDGLVEPLFDSMSQK